MQKSFFHGLLGLLQFLVFYPEARAASFAEVLLGQTAAQPIVADEYLETVSPAFGIGTYSNTIYPGSADILEHTNSNFFIIGLDLNGYSSHIYLPYKDSLSSRQGRIDSDVLRLQTGLHLTDHLHLDFLYSHAKGFYSGDLENTQKTLRLYPDLTLRRWGTTLTYLVDSTHQSTLSSPIIYLKPQTSKSVYISGEFFSHRLHGLDNVEQNQNFESRGTLSSISMSTLSAIFGFSQSRMYENFFWSYSLGFGLGAGYLQTTTSSDFKKDRWDAAVTVPGTGTVGWIQDRLTIGIYTQIRSWRIEAEQLVLSSNNGTTGLYGSFVF